jgi:hypothetical protein
MPALASLSQADLDALAAEEAAAQAAAQGYVAEPVPAPQETLVPAGTAAPPTTTVAYPTAGPVGNTAVPYDYGQQIPSSTPVPAPAQTGSPPQPAYIPESSATRPTPSSDPYYVPSGTSAYYANVSSQPMAVAPPRGQATQSLPTVNTGTTTGGLPSGVGNIGLPGYSERYRVDQENARRQQSQPGALTPTRPSGDFLKGEFGRFLGLDPDRTDLDMYNQFVLNTRNKLGDVGEGLKRFPEGAAKLVTTPLNAFQTGWTNPPNPFGDPDAPLRENWGQIEDTFGPWGLYPRGAQEASQNYLTDPVSDAVTAVRDLAGRAKDTYMDEPTKAWQAGIGDYFDRSYQEQSDAIAAGKVAPGETNKLQATEDAAAGAVESINKVATGIPTQAELEAMSIDGLRAVMSNPRTPEAIKQRAAVLVGRYAARETGLYEGPLINTPDVRGAVGSAVGMLRGAVDASRGAPPQSAYNVLSSARNSRAPSSQAMPSPPPADLVLGPPAQPAYIPESSARLSEAPASLPIPPPPTSPQPERALPVFSLGAPQAVPTLELRTIAAPQTFEPAQPSLLDRARAWGGRQRDEFSANSQDNRIFGQDVTAVPTPDLPQWNLGLPQWNLAAPPLPTMNAPTNLDALPVFSLGEPQVVPTPELRTIAAPQTFAPAQPSWQDRARAGWGRAVDAVQGATAPTTTVPPPDASFDAAGNWLRSNVVEPFQRNNADEEVFGTDVGRMAQPDLSGVAQRLSDAGTVIGRAAENVRTSLTPTGRMDTSAGSVPYPDYADAGSLLRDAYAGRGQTTGTGGRTIYDSVNEVGTRQPIANGLPAGTQRAVHNASGVTLIADAKGNVYGLVDENGKDVIFPPDITQEEYEALRADVAAKIAAKGKTAEPVAAPAGGGVVSSGQSGTGQQSGDSTSERSSGGGRDPYRGGSYDTRGSGRSSGYGGDTGGGDGQGEGENDLDRDFTADDFLERAGGNRIKAQMMANMANSRKRRGRVRGAPRQQSSMRDDILRAITESLSKPPRTR